MAVALLLLALLGHAAFWVALANRIDGLVIRRTLCKTLTKLVILCAAAIPLVFVVRNGRRWPPSVSGLSAAYVAFCWLMGTLAIGIWLWRNVLFPRRTVPRRERSTLHDLRATAPDRHGLWQFWTHLPGNEAFRPEVNDLELSLSRLPPTLEGLRLVQLTDLHFSASVGKAYFEAVVQLSNEFSPDLVLLTGDLTERDAHIDWIPDTLGRLTSRNGAYFVLGNHDILIDTPRLCRTLQAAGLTHLDGRYLQLKIRGTPVILAGREQPWFSAPAAVQRLPPREAPAGPLVIGLTHTPDQLPWAQAHGVDLLLAGHTHGGQICLPWIGPIIVPSRWGVRYAAGTFQVGPTLMHVSRGISGKYPIRFHCPPELTRLVLCRS